MQVCYYRVHRTNCSKRSIEILNHEPCGSFRFTDSILFFFLSIVLTVALYRIHGIYDKKKKKEKRKEKRKEKKEQILNRD